MTAEELVGTKILVTGHIHNVTFKEQNYETGGFAIFRFDIEKIKEGKLPEEFGDLEWDMRAPITFSGPAPSLSLRQEYEIYAELTKHERFGYQYRIIKMTERIAFDNKDDVFKFFSYIFPEKTTEEILKALPDPIKVLEEEDVGELLKIKGVGLARADRIIKKYKETRMDCKAYVALYNIGLTLNMIQKLCIAYGSAETLVAKIYENPYMLIYDVNGIGWRKADQIAFDMGIAKDDKRRVIAYIYYILDKMGEDEGHTYIGLDDLVEQIKEEVSELTDNKIRIYILELIKDGKVYYEKTTRRLGLMEHRIIEEKIARELYRISNARGFELKGASGVIADCEKSTGFTYSEEQRQAIYNCLTNNVVLITGLAGAGKSSVMYPVTQIIKNNQRQLAQVALSGKAALNLTEITGIEGSTIHRLLGYNPAGGFAHNKLNPLLYDAIILDEASMVDERIFLYLLEAIPSGSKLIILGDTGQLEPIGIGCVFRDLIESKKIPHTHFNKIFRQAEKSGIITSSREVYDGVPIMKPRQYAVEIRGELKDFEIIGISETNQALVKIVEKYKWFMDEKKATVDDMMIVVAKRAIGDTSARKINESIQRLVNGIPQCDDITIHKADNGTAYDVTFRVGDKILVTKNCYDTKDIEGKNSPVFNGNVGTILNLSWNGMIARFIQGDIFLARENFQDLELGYAITCHKIQGSGYPYVITVCDNGAYTLLSKEWLYTAITRARKYNVLVAQPGAVVRACGKTSVREKRTWLKEFVVNIFNNQGKTVEEVYDPDNDI